MVLLVIIMVLSRYITELRAQLSQIDREYTTFRELVGTPGTLAGVTQTKHLAAGDSLHLSQAATVRFLHTATVEIGFAAHVSTM